MKLTLKFFRADDRKDEINDQAQCNDSDAKVDHGMGVVGLDFAAGDREDRHQREEAEGCQGV